MAKRSKAKKAALDIFYELATRGAVLLAVATAFLSMYPPSPLAPLYHNPDPKAQANVVLYFAIVMVVALFVYIVIVLIIYRALKRGLTRKDLATGREFDDTAIQQAEAAPAPRDRKKAVTIPTEQFDKEVAWLFESIYPIKTKAVPVLFRYEIIAVLLKHVYRGTLTAEEATNNCNLLLAQPVQALVDDALLRRGYELASQFNRPTAYDSQYLAVAERLSCEFWTADERLYNVLKAHIMWVKWLGNFTQPTEALP